MQPPRVLISSFQPFGGESYNPSEEVTNALSDDYHTITLPVTRYTAPEILIERAREIRPDILLMLGESGGSPEIKLERVAINMDDFHIPDHAQNQPYEEPIYQHSSAAYFSTLPLTRIKQELLHMGIPCSISNSAGTYLCNHLFYSIRHRLPPSLLTGFIHLPYLPEQLHNKPPGTPYMNLNTMIQATRSIATICSAHC